MKKMRVFCGAKVNLSLNVGKRRHEDGYHFIDSVMQSVDLGDYMDICLRADEAVAIDFIDEFGKSIRSIDQSNNSVKKAIDLIKNSFGGFGVDVRVQKRIPLSGGMGGSSANAAGVIFALSRLLGLDECGVDVMNIAALAGSDVPFMMAGGCGLVSGVGQRVRLMKNNLPLFFVVARNGLACGLCNSGVVYSVFDRIAKDGIICNNLALTKLLAEGNLLAYDLFSNALSEAAIETAPLVGGVVDAIGAIEGVRAVNVSGSGDCVYGCLDSFDKALGAANCLRAKGYDAFACRSAECGIKIV